MRLTVFSALVLAFSFVSERAVSESAKIAGSDTLEFTTAREMWLAGDDMQALEELAALSRKGNRAAQLLLASISVRGNMHAHVTSELDRTRRIELLRLPGGLSGKSWLTEAQKDEPLATALLQAKQVGEKAAAIAALVELGEPQTALIAAQSLLFQGEADTLIEVLDGLDDKLPDEAETLLIWVLDFAASSANGRYTGSARPPPVRSGDDRFLVSELAWVPPTPKGILEDRDRRDEVVRLSDEVRSWTPVRTYCERNCPASADTCTAVGVSLLRASGPFPMRSPLESLISDTTYWSSPRIEGDLARSIADLRRYDDGTFDSVDACFVRSMKASQAEHGYGR